MLFRSFLVSKEEIEEEQLMDIVLEAGAEDLETTDDGYQIITEPQDFEKVKAALTEKEIKVVASELTRMPKSSVDVDAKTGTKILTLMELLDEHEDIQKVSANFSLPDDFEPIEEE